MTGSGEQKAVSSKSLGRNSMRNKIILIALCALLFALCSSAQAQQPKKVFPRGYLSSFDPAFESTGSEGIGLALRELGYMQGQNISIDYRYGEGRSIGTLSLRPS